MSVFEDVLVWCDEITTLLEREISVSFSVGWTDESDVFTVRVERSI
jgi:hypothetical protein